jgi:hypothetical protein
MSMVTIKLWLSKREVLLPTWNYQYLLRTSFSWERKKDLNRKSCQTDVPNFYPDEFRRKFVEQNGALLFKNFLPNMRSLFEMPYSTYLKDAFRINYAQFVRNFIRRLLKGCSLDHSLTILLLYEYFSVLLVKCSSEFYFRNSFFLLH